MAARVPRQERGEQRRDVLVAAAVEVVAAGGPVAFSARSVAAQSGLPLAAVSYYFPRLEDLLGAAIAVVVGGWVEHGATVVGALEAVAGGTGVELAAATLADALLPPGDSTAIRHRYEQLLATASYPVAAAAMADLRPQLLALVERVLDRTRTSSLIGEHGVIALLDGAAVGAVSENPETEATATALRQQIVATVRLALRDR
ncbi:MAG: hypothetical protein ABWZ98_02225 [Nakamurella sp.]